MRPLVRSTLSVPCLIYTAIESSKSPTTECDSSSELSFDIEGHHTPFEPLGTGLEYADHMNEVGWLLNGVFTTLLSSVGSSFYQKEGRMKISRGIEDTSEALAALISEL